MTNPNYCVFKFTATDGRFYSDFIPRSRHHCMVLLAGSYENN
ncbi:hypothetical protein [Prevotella sp. ne3005]|nr:hypothetical protein [Prevotella sp. ne3005]